MNSNFQNIEQVHTILNTRQYSCKEK